MKYIATLPDQDRCKALGIKLEGLETRTRLWLMGVAFGVFHATGRSIQASFPTGGKVTIETSDQNILNHIKEHLESYGCTFEQVIPPCPFCKGERELDGLTTGTGYSIFYCGFCGTRST
jgi:hypothetical protein